MSVGIRNLQAFKKRLNKRVLKSTEDKLKKLIFESALLVERTAKDSILSGNKTGNVYIRGGKPHIASAKGEAPANDGGNLLSGISTRVKEMRSSVIGQVFTNSHGLSPYGRDLEFGTKNMDKRPFMQPALEKNRPKIRRKFKNAKYIK